MRTFKSLSLVPKSVPSALLLRFIANFLPFEMENCRVSLMAKKTGPSVLLHWCKSDNKSEELLAYKTYDRTCPNMENMVVSDTGHQARLPSTFVLTSFIEILLNHSLRPTMR